jgi:hypothetical protein
MEGVAQPDTVQEILDRQAPGARVGERAPHRLLERVGQRLQPALLAERLDHALGRHVSPPFIRRNEPVQTTSGRSRRAARGLPQVPRRDEAGQRGIERVSG